MRLIHGWPNEEAKKVKGLYGLRKTPVFKNKARRSGPVKTLPSKACPVFGCRSVIKNVSRHIRAVHKIDRRSDKYRQLLARAVTVDLYRSKTKLVSKISHLPSRRDKHYLQQLLRNDIEMGDNSSDSSFSEVSSFTANDFQSSSDISENSSLSSKNTSNSSTESLESSNDLDSSTGSENLELAFLDSNHSAFNSEVQSIFAKFFEFLVSPDSGNRERRSAKYCVKRVMRVFDVVSPDQNLNSLCDRLLLRDTFLKSYCTAQNYHPVTIMVGPLFWLCHQRRCGGIQSRQGGTNEIEIADVEVFLCSSSSNCNNGQTWTWAKNKNNARRHSKIWKFQSCSRRNRAN